MNVIKKTEVLMGISGSLDSLGRSTCKSSKWRQGGLVVSTLDFRSEGWWFQPGLCCHEYCFLRQQTFLHIVPLQPCSGLVAIFPVTLCYGNWS